MIRCILFLLALATQSLAQSGPFQAKISVKGLRREAKVIMTVRVAGDWAEYTATSSNGTFELKGDLKEPAFAYVVLKYADELNRPPRMGNILEVFLSPGEVQVTAADSLNASTVKGGKEQQEFAEFVKSVGKNTDEPRRKAIKAFVAKYPDSFVSLTALQNFSKPGSFTIEAGEVRTLFGGLSARLRNSAIGKEIAGDIDRAERTAVGAIAPDFSQQDSTGRAVSLSSLRGKYVLIDFWASWCKPCRADNPELVKTWERFNRKGFTIIGVSLDQARTPWVRAIRKDHLTWTHVSDLKFWKNEVALQYGVKTVPQNVLLDPKGKIIARNLSMKQLPAMLEKVMK